MKEKGRVRYFDVQHSLFDIHYSLSHSFSRLLKGKGSAPKVRNGGLLLYLPAYPIDGWPVPVGGRVGPGPGRKCRI